MDKTDLNERPKRARVLRAADVMPPFDKDGPQPGRGEQQLEPASSGTLAAGSNARGRSASGLRSAGDSVGQAGWPMLDDAEIPTYDLAENILAEQRQVAARRRRGPGKAEDEPVAPAIDVGPKTFISEISSGELRELQRVVAEIVARDIERLCRRPNRQPQAYP